MATATHAIASEDEAPVQTPEQAICEIFDIVEDALEKLTPEKRKAWLDDLSATVQRLEKQAWPSATLANRARFPIAIIFPQSLLLSA